MRKLFVLLAVLFAVGCADTVTGPDFCDGLMIQRSAALANYQRGEMSWEEAMYHVELHASQCSR